MCNRVNICSNFDWKTNIIVVYTCFFFVNWCCVILRKLCRAVLFYDLVVGSVPIGLVSSPRLNWEFSLHWNILRCPSGLLCNFTTQPTQDLSVSSSTCDWVSRIHPAVHHLSFFLIKTFLEYAIDWLVWIRSHLQPNLWVLRPSVKINSLIWLIYCVVLSKGRWKCLRYLE